MVRKAILLNFLSSSTTSFSINHKNLRKKSPSHSNYILCYPTHSFFLQLHLFKPNIWSFCRNTASGFFVQSQHLVFFIFRETAMTRNELLVLTIFNSLAKTLEVDNTDNRSQELIVSHSDCTKMQDNRMYSLNKEVECKISPENLYIAPATITPYQKNYRTDLSATMCSVKVNVFRYNCGRFSHTLYVHDQNSIIYDMIVTPEVCRFATNSKKIKISAFDENFDVLIELDENT